MSRATAGCSGMAAESGAARKGWQARRLPPLPLAGEGWGEGRQPFASVRSRKLDATLTLPSPASGRGVEWPVLRHRQSLMRALEGRRDIGHETLHLLLHHRVRLQPVIEIEDDL